MAHLHDKLNLTNLYMREAANHRLLSREEERKLTTACKNGCREARQAMLEHNQRLVVKQATCFQHFGLPLLDLIQEGNLGLMKALDKFNPELGHRFSTYATWWIRHCMERLISNQRRSVRLPVHVEERLRKVKKISEQIQKETARDATDKEIAERLGVSIKRIQSLKRYGQYSISLDSPVNDEMGAKTIGDFIGTSDEDEMEQKELAKTIEGILADLTPREARIISLRYGLAGKHPHTLEEVGVKYGLTRERIRQIEKGAMQRLRHPSRIRKLGIFFKEPLLSASGDNLA